MFDRCTGRKWIEEHPFNALRKPRTYDPSSSVKRGAELFHQAQKWVVLQINREYRLRMYLVKFTITLDKPSTL